MAQYISMYQIPAHTVGVSGSDKPHLLAWPKGFVFEISL